MYAILRATQQYKIFFCDVYSGSYNEFIFSKLNVNVCNEYIVIKLSGISANSIDSNNVAIGIISIIKHLQKEY